MTSKYKVLKVKTDNQDVALIKKGNKYLCLEISKVHNADFKESDHPRDKGGKFTSKGGEGGGTEKEQKPSERIEIAEGYEKSVSPQRFHNKIKEAKATVDERARWRVTVHEADEYRGHKLYVTEKGSTVAVTSDGDIISVCRKKDDKVRGSDLLKKAVANGGNKLDAFEGLYGFYARNGFEPVSWCEFDEEYAPEGWDKNKDKKERIIFWKYTGKNYEGSKDDFLTKTKKSNSYDEAMEKRNNEMEK